MHIDKVCFIIPPSPFLSDERVFPSLGILSVAAAIENKFPVGVMDLSGIKNYLDVVTDYINMEKGKVVFCPTATTPQLPNVVNILKVIREKAPGARTILGGPHTTLTHAAARYEQKNNISGRATVALSELHKLADILVTGDGEMAIHEALGDNPPSLVDGDNPKTNLFLNNMTFDQIKWPARHLIDLNSYKYTIDGVRATTLISQLGCPFNCGFCGGRDSNALRRVRTRSVKNIIDEMAFLYSEYGYQGFMFYDDELNIKDSAITELMESIIDLQKRLGVEFRLRGFIKSQLFTDKQAALMYKAGFRWVLIGFESGSPRILKNIQKMATLEDNSLCMEIARRNNLKVKALMSLGHPGESRETALMTRDWLLKEKPDEFDLTVITVYPGTPYYDKAIKHPTRERVFTYTINGDALHSIGLDCHQEASFYKGIPGEYKSYVFTDNLEPQDIVDLQKAIEKEVRKKLRIPPPKLNAAIQYEHTMGMSTVTLPQNIFRSTTSCSS